MPSLQQARARQDENAFYDFYQKEYEGVVRYVMRAGACLHDAEYAAQEAFLTMWNLMTRGRWSAVRFPGAYVRMSALNQYRADAKREQRLRVFPLTQPDHDLGIVVPGPEDLTLATLTAVDMLRSLDPDCQEVFLLYQDGYKQHEIAEVLGLSPIRVKNLLSRSRRTLRVRAHELGLGATQRP